MRKISLNSSRIMLLLRILPLLTVVLAAVVLAAGSLALAADTARITTDTIKVDIPDYLVTVKNGADYVDLPGGDALVSEEGRPRVPYWIWTIDCPAGQRVQNVLLQERSGQKSVFNLKLPVVVVQDDPKVPVAMKSGWYPQDIFRWRISEHVDGSSTLAITIFPFYYNPDTGESAFYQKYAFAVESITSTVQITSMTVGREIFPLGEKISVDLALNNAAAALDVIISLAVRNITNSEIVGELPLGVLQSLSGDASYSAVWDTAGLPAGEYLLETALLDANGNYLDSAKLEVVLKTTADIRPTVTPAPVPPVWKTNPALTLIGLIAAGILVLLAVILLVVWSRKPKTAQSRPRH